MVIESDMGTSDHPRSLSYTSDTNCNSPHCSSLGWDLHNLGVLNADMSLVMSSAVMGSTPPYFSDLDSDHDLSTGYLEDALLEFGDRSKRRRLSFCGEDRTAKEFDDRALGYWNSTCGWGVDENYNGASEITSFTRLSDEMGSSRSRTSEDTNFFPEVKTQEDVVSSLDSSSPFKEPSSRTKSGSDKEVQFTLDAMPSSEMGAGGEKMRRQERVVLRRVVYPFAVVKPCGADGDVTLNDINERLLMPPTRPVRHPVGDFACRPCVSPHGPGLSGKAVVALTRLHTQGRGTITIIRTKG